MIVFKELTKRQKKKADQVAKLLKELKKEGVAIMVNDGGGGAPLSYIRMTPYEFDWVQEVYYSVPNRQSEFEEKEYINLDCPVIDCGAI